MDTIKISYPCPIDCGGCSCHISAPCSHCGNKHETVETFEVENLNQVSDGYHTIAELYDHRIALFIALCKQIQQQPYDDDAKFGVWRSKKHSDGTDAYEGWFVLGYGTKDGEIVTYHLPLSYWEKTNFAQEIERSHFDGHTSQDVLVRLLKNI